MTVASGAKALGSVDQPVACICAVDPRGRQSFCRRNAVEIREVCQTYGTL